MGLTKQNFIHKEEKPKTVIEWSFDDGYELDLKVADILESFGHKAVFYIVLDNVGKRGYLNWDQVKELEKRGHEIGSHTVSHPQDLKALFDEELHYEVQNSKDMLEIVLGHSVAKFCYPRGRYDERVQAFVNRAGYVYARATGKPGITEMKDVLAVPGTVHIFQRKEYENVPVLEYAQRQIDKVKKEGGYCNIWGHSKEIDENHLWEVLEEVCKYVKVT